MKREKSDLGIAEKKPDLGKILIKKKKSDSKA